MDREELAQTLQRVGRGDRAAFRRVYEATSAKLHGVCLRILQDRQLAEDVLQDVYVTIWRKAEGFDASRASPITWLATIARNRSIDRLRSPSVVRTARPLDEAFAVADDAPLPESSVEAADEARRLHGCLDTLEDKARGAIRTAFFDGETYETLARREGVPLGTMKSWIRRGLARLRECLAS